LYAEQSGDRDINREFAAYQQTRNEEESQHLEGDRQNSRLRSDEADRYFWWWPFRR
jgi:hypothetical protein